MKAFADCNMLPVQFTEVCAAIYWLYLAIQSVTYQETDFH